MPRQARKKSESGIYHIMLRGINRQQIFCDDEDCRRFLATLAKYKAQCGYEIYAYCLMGNHIHILLKEGKEDLALALKKIAGSYVYWYNWKYRRCGHLFQDRFKSEPVETDAYFLAAMRYIHQNPVKAGLCKAVDAYEFSSYREYLTQPTLVDSAFCLGMMDAKEFAEFNNTYNDEVCMDEEADTRIPDDEAKRMICEICGSETAPDLQTPKKRKEAIPKLHQAGLSIRQISRTTGLSRKAVEHGLKRGTREPSPCPPLVEIRQATAEDFDFILRLNEENVEVLAPMDRERLACLAALSAFLWVAAVDGERAAFLIALTRDADSYDSENYRWFRRQYDRFLYVDRIVIDAPFRGMGLGRALYEAVFRFAREENIPVVTAEIDTVPYNGASLKFHRAMGFHQVGTQYVRNGSVQVSLQAAETGV